MRDPFRWTKRLGSIPSWIKGAIGLLGSIVAFALAFRQNRDLYITVAVVLILGFGFITSLSSLSAPRRSRTKKVKRWNYRIERQQMWGLVGLAGTVLVSGLLLSNPVTRTVGWQSVFGTPSPTAPPRQPNPDILIATFSSEFATKKRDVSQVLWDELDQRLSKLGMENITLDTDPQVVTSKSAAQTLANERGARAIIWGVYDDESIQVNTFLSANDQPGEMVRGTSRIPLSTGGDPTAELSYVVDEILPDNVSFLSLFLIGHLDYQANNYEAGHAAFDAAMDNIPDNVHLANESLVHFFLARQADSTGVDVTYVICEYAKAIELDPDFALAYNNLGTVFGRFIKTDIMFQKVELVSEPSPEAVRCMEQAGLNHEQFSEPRDFYHRALEVDPNLTMAEFNLAVIEWKLERVGASESRFLPVFEEFQRRDTSLAGPYIIQGVLLEKYAGAAAAIEKFEEGLAAAPSNPQLHFLLGQLYLSHEKDETKAEKEFLAAIELDPLDAEARLALANMFVGSGRLGEAAKTIEPILGMDTSSLESNSATYGAHVLQSQIYLEQGNKTAAIATLEQAVPAEDKMPYASFLLGLLYQSEGQETRALESFGRVISAPDGLGEGSDELQSDWNEFAWKCFPMDATEPMLPKEGCLPSAQEERTDRLYALFHEMVVKRRVVQEPPFVGAECPYVYTVNPETQRWEFETTILYRIVSVEATQARELSRFDGRLLIRELEPEISYIDRLVVMAEMDDGSIQILTPQLHTLQEDDGRIITLQQGDELLVMMSDTIPEVSVRRWWLVATGYYTPLQK
jgi:tetratricopeptide (TPR) repeat protein